VSEHDEREDYDDEARDRPLAPARVVQWPSVIMWGIGLLQLILTQTWVVFVASVLVIRGNDDNLTAGEVWDIATGDSLFWTTFAAWPFVTAATFLVMKAGNDFRRFRHFWLVVTGAIIVLLSIPAFFCGVIQIPLSLWMLAVLVRRDVRARLEAVARGTITPSPPEAPDARTD
jgi:hypothetical protein